MFLNARNCTPTHTYQCADLRRKLVKRTALCWAFPKKMKHIKDSFLGGLQGSENTNGRTIPYVRLSRSSGERCHRRQLLCVWEATWTNAREEAGR